MGSPPRGLADFNAIRWGETPVSRQEERLKKVARHILSLNPGRLLDIGCGDGGFSVQFIDKGWEVWGVDLAEGPLRKAQARGIHTQRQDVSEGLPFPDRFFYVVVASEVIEHLVDTDQLLEEVRRVLLPGGVFLLTTANLASLNNRFRLFLGMYPTAMDYSARQGLGHVRYYTMRVLLRQLKEHGFWITHVFGSYVPLVPTRWTFRKGPQLILPLARLLGDIFPALAMEIAVEARLP